MCLFLLKKKSQPLHQHIPLDDDSPPNSMVPFLLTSKWVMTSSTWDGFGNFSDGVPEMMLISSTSATNPFAVARPW